MVSGISLVVILVIGSIFCRPDTKQEKEMNRGLVISSDASDWGKDQNAETFHMSLVNPEGNPCYLKYTLEIPEASEVLYDSELIEPGKAITEFAVDNLPEKGDYELFINIGTYSLDKSLESMNGAQVKTILHVV